jgi:hypothetical protein
MTVRPLAAALLAAAALGIAACGDAEEPAATAASSEDDTRQAQLKFAECMREQGVNFPDPGADGGTKVQVKSETEAEAFQAASEACKEFREAARPELSEADQQEFKERALEHARCMREHGIDMPDPEFSAEGGVRMRLDRGNGIDPGSPEFQAAQEECGGGMMMGKPATP